jgi:glycerophosphoryl diester phosphodiesterase
MYKKTKPLVIGHRGNPMKYQENTLDGFKSLLETNADGFEMDIYVTKDDKLVVFHDDNTKVS